MLDAIREIEAAVGEQVQQHAAQREDVSLRRGLFAVGDFRSAISLLVPAVLVVPDIAIPGCSLTLYA